MTTQIKHQSGLSHIHDDALYIRKTVFVTEQGVPLDDELDNPENEEKAIHIVAYVANQPAATARLLEETPGTWHVQRVATLKNMRQRGIGKEIFHYIEVLAPSYHIHCLYLGAQLHASPFYTQIGFVAYGPEFIEAGIKHISMKKELN